jgi:murein L,D-transpeptidase YafK
MVFFQKTFSLAAFFLIVFLGGATSQAATNPPHPKTAILVDKKTNTLRVCEIQDGVFKVIKTFHATLGQVQGDKEDEGDLKTPEGIYTAKTRLTPPGLKPIFGSMAFYLNFPNTFDQLAGHRGSDIMLHATDTPDRLKKNYDSKGCVVVNNDEIKEIAPYIRLGLTPIIIFPELTDEFLNPGQDPKLSGFFQDWIQAWESRDVNKYIEHYHTDFVDHGKNRDAWKKYKDGLTRMYSEIRIHPEDVVYIRHPKYSMITFTQNYQSKLQSGGWGHRSRGTKILYIAEEQGQPRIIAESYTPLMW